MIVCVAGNPSIDRLIEVEALAPGEIHRPSSLVVLPGGKGLHVARVCAVLGSPATATGILAGHAGRWITEALAHEGVLGWFAWGPGETRSCLSVADRATGALTEFYEPGTPGTAQAWSDLVGIVASLLNSTRWLVLSGSLPPETPVEGYAQLIVRAAAAGVPAVVDSREPWLAAALDAGPALVKINAYEASELLEEPVADGERGVAAARTIRDRAGGDGHAVTITLGEAGMVLVDPDGRTFTGSSSARGPTQWAAATRSWPAWWWRGPTGNRGRPQPQPGSGRAPPTPRSPAPDVSIPPAPASWRRLRTWLSSQGEARAASSTCWRVRMCSARRHPGRLVGSVTRRSS